MNTVYQGINTIDQDPIQKDSRHTKGIWRDMGTTCNWCAKWASNSQRRQIWKNTPAHPPRKGGDKHGDHHHKKSSAYTLQISPEKKMYEIGWTFGKGAWREGQRAAKAKYGLIASWRPPRQFELDCSGCCSKSWWFDLLGRSISNSLLTDLPLRSARHDAVGELHFWIAFGC